MSAPRGGWLGALLSALIYALAAGALAYPFLELQLAAVTALAACLGALAAPSVARTRLRSLPLSLLSVGCAVLAVALSRTLDDQRWLAQALGPVQALFVTSVLGAALTSSSLSLGLRALSLRRRIFSLVEVLVVAGSFAQLVVAHRFGAINRPFELADSIIAQGGDPTVALLFIGAVAGVLVVMLLLQERSFLRALLHFTLAVCLLLLVFSSTRMLGLPSPPAGTSGLGLRPDEQAGKTEQKKRGQQAQSKSDNENLEFRDNYDSQGRQVPLAVVLLHDDYSPPLGLYYFRQTAFSQFNGKRLVSATGSHVDSDIAPAFVSQETDLGAVPNALGDRLQLDTTVALLADHTRPFALESAERIAPMQNPDTARFRRVYRVTSSALAARPVSLIARGVGEDTWSPELRAHYTAAPADDRYEKLAQEIVLSMKLELRDDPVARALAVSAWLSKEGTYSLKSGHANAADPTADFLFGDRIGYCVHFAHAAVYLLRTLGIPARVGVGYVVDEAARQGGSSILITGANSHAWPEFYVAGVGWVVDDVSPARALDPPPPSPDPDLQRLLGDMARGLKPMPQSSDRPFEPLIANARWLRDVVLTALVMLAMWTLAFLYVVKVWRRVAPVFARDSLPRVGYRAELDRLAENALHRRFGETREAFAQRVASAAPSFARLTERHVATTFGARRRDPKADRAELSALRKQVARELRTAVSWWRRWLGALTPWSWLRSR